MFFYANGDVGLSIVALVCLQWKKILANLTVVSSRVSEISTMLKFTKIPKTAIKSMTF